MNSSTTDFQYAGIIFIQDNFVLAGLQRKWIRQRNGNSWKEERFISGFGGRKNQDETSLRTAIRETLEELYEFINVPNYDFDLEMYESKNIFSIRKNTKIPQELLFKIEKEIHFVGPYIKNGYHLYQSNYNDLNNILEIVNQYLSEIKPNIGKFILSIAYRNNLPKNINELISFPRQDLHDNLEILQIYSLFIDGEELQKKEVNNIISGEKFVISQIFSEDVDRIKNNNYFI